ncbi:MAG: serine kinase [Gemmobacter sp.]|nr:serine kinase [Gemmobacter sp.]
MQDRGPARNTPDDPVIHATTIAFGTRAVVILGPSASGKSSLGLMLMALGGQLVADDRTLLRSRGGMLIASAPPDLPPLIEARGIGLLRADLCTEARVVLAVDLGQTETLRLPPRRKLTFGSVAVDVVHGPATPHFPAAIRQYIMSGREV